MQSPKLTIITATCNLIQSNRKETFAQAIESVVNQDYKDYEHIIIDNASTDGTLHLLNEYQEKGYITYYSEKDSGIYNAYNKGIKLAKGKYIAFLNSDDFFTRIDAFSIVIKCLDQTKADFTYAPFTALDRQGNFLRKNQTGLNYFPIKMNIGHGTMFARKSMLEKVNYFNENYIITADYDLLNRILVEGYTPVAIEKCFVAWREGGISDTNRELRMHEDIKVIASTCKTSFAKAKKYYEYECLPPKKLANILESFSPNINKEEILNANKKRYHKHIKRQFFTFRFSKRHKVIRLLGITFCNNNPIKNIYE